jgi:homoserine dehydrogenase
MTTKPVSQPQPNSSEDFDNLITIEGISNGTVLQYFATMNAEDFPSTAALFAATGAMEPPFESPITGQDAIATYLQQEAQNLRLLPHEGIIELGEDEQQEIQVSGEVETPYFRVNVTWSFILNAEQEITYVRIKLLASPEELLKMRR